MIKFTRKLRLNLILDGKIGGYLKYATGEILLVVIGILIAIQINNWNESKKLNIKEIEFLSSVVNDLKQDRAFLQYVIDLTEPRIFAYKSLNSDLQYLYQNDRSTLDSLFNDYFETQRTFYPISSSYQSAVSGNQLSSFQNEQFIRKVVKLYNSTYDRLIDNGQILDDRWGDLSKKYSFERRTGKFRDMNPQQLSEFLDDVFHHYIQMEYYLSQLKLTIIEIDEIIEEN